MVQLQMIKDPEKKKQSRREYYYKNRESEIAGAIEWQRENKDRYNAARKIRRKKKKLVLSEFGKQRITQIERACVLAKQRQAQYIRNQEKKYYEAKRGVEIYLLKRATRHMEIWRQPVVSESEREFRRKFGGG